MKIAQVVGFISGHSLKDIREEIGRCPDGLLRDVLEDAWSDYLEKIGWPLAIANQIVDMLSIEDDDTRDALHEALVNGFSAIGQEGYDKLIGTEIIEEGFWEDLEREGVL